MSADTEEEKKEEKKETPPVTQLDFDLALETIPVTMKSKDGTIKRYTLQEMLGKERDAYLTAISGRMKFNDRGKVCGIKSFDGLNAQLLTRCLVDNETNELVTIEVLQNLPAKVQSKLFKEAQRINALDEDGKDEAKNDSEEN